ncbi:MAG: LuxR C-terminal-related transcriptional regulator [Nitrincola sp.]|nr:LuxR C-terminal-related transcriptional regulator [Nitrincola sp.]
MGLVAKALELAELRFEAFREHQKIQSRYATLSQREREVMSLVIDGLANREIAETLGISPKNSRSSSGASHV